MISGTDIRIAPYIMARLIHAIIAAILTIFLLPAVEALSGISAVSTFINSIQPQNITMPALLLKAGANMFKTVGTLSVISFVTYTIKSVKIISIRMKQ